MRLAGYLLILLVVCIAIYAFFIQSAESDAETLSVANESNGTFDVPAQQAIRKINAKKKPTAKERIARADIVRFNINDDVIDDEAIAFALADDYMHGALEADTPEVADMAADRLRTLGGALADDVIVNIGGATIVAGGVVVDGVPATAVVAEEAAARANVARKQEAAAGAKNRTDAAKKYLKSSAVIKNDQQNVHDNLANNDMRDSLKRIRISIGQGIEPRHAIASARAMINKKEWQDANPDINVSKALQALDIIQKGNSISTFESTEDRIFADIWSRATHPDNILNEKELKASIAHALSDCIEGGGPVCINGRCARVIGSLASIDADAEIGKIGTFDTYKAKIIAESGKVMETKLAELRKTTPDEVAKWEAGDDSPVSKQLSDAIAKHVDTYKKEIPAVQLDAIRNTCVTAVL